MRYETKMNKKFPSNDDISDNKDKLLKQFIKNTTKQTNSEDKVDSVVHSNNRNNQIDCNFIETKKLKIRVKELEKQIILQKQKYKELRYKYISETDKINKYFDLYTKTKLELDNILQLKQDNEQLKKEMSQVISERTSYIHQIKTLKETIKNLDIAKRELINTFKQNEKEYNKKIDFLEDEISVGKKSLKGLNEKWKISKQEILNLSLRLEQQSKLIKEKDKKIYLLDNFVKESKNNKETTISNLEKTSKLILSHLKNNVNFSINDIKHRVETFFSKKYSKNGEKVYGHIKYNRFFGYKFISLEGNQYRARIYNKLKLNKDSNMCGCVGIAKTEKEVLIIFVYKNSEKFLEATKNKNQNKPKKLKNIQNTKKEEDNLYSNSPKILIITALNNTKYLEKLNKVGLKVDYFNSYYNNAKRLNSMLSKYDLVLYCTEHSKHYVKDVFKNQPDYSTDKYLMIKDDSVCNILKCIDNYINNNKEDIEKEIASE